MQDNTDNPQREFRQWNSTLKRKTPLLKQRKPLANNSTPIKRGKRPKPMSDKRREESKEYSAIRKDLLGDVFNQDKPECEAKLRGHCTWFASEDHHMEGRGVNYLRKDKILLLCHGCHSWLTEHSKEAIEMGLSIRRNQPLRKI